MTDFDTVDYFTDPSLVPDPHPYTWVCDRFVG